MGLERQLLSVVEKLYAAPLSNDAWEPALEEIAEVLGAGHAILMAQPAEPEKMPFMTCARVDERDLARSFAAAQYCDPGALSADVIPAGSVVSRSALVRDSDYERTAHYNEVIRPMNGFFGLFVHQRVANTQFMVSICRSLQNADFAASDAAVIERLMPHFKSSIALSQRISDVELQLGGLAQALSRSRDGVLLLDGRGRCCFANPLAMRIAAENDGFVMDESGVSAGDRSASLRLRSAIAAAVADGAIGAASVLLPRPSQRLPLVASIMPVGRFDLSIAGTGAPRVALFLRETDAPPRIDLQLLADLFHLTPRESQIASMLATGRNLEAIAAALHMGCGTVRYHLKNVFHKTGTHHQGALVALIRGLADL